MELELEEVEAAASEDEAAAASRDQETVRGFTRRRPVRGPLPAHLPRERVVLPSPMACPCCGGRLAKLGESITERCWRIIRRLPAWAGQRWGV
jgi:transposase